MCTCIGLLTYEYICNTLGTVVSPEAARQTECGLESFWHVGAEEEGGGGGGLEDAVQQGGEEEEVQRSGQGRSPG